MKTVTVLISNQINIQPMFKSYYKLYITLQTDITFMLDRPHEHVSKFHDLYYKDSVNLPDIVPKRQQRTKSQMRYQISIFGTKRFEIVPKC